MKVLIIPSIGAAGIAYYRIWTQAMASAEGMEYDGCEVPEWAQGVVRDLGPQWLDRALAGSYDAIYAPYCSNTQRMLSVRLLRDRLGCPLMVDFDDLYTDLPRTNQSYVIGHGASDSRRSWDAYMEMADMVTTTTESLASMLPTRPGVKTHILPNFGRPEDYAAERRPHDDIRILFSGASGGHWLEYEFLAPVIDRLSRRYPQTKWVCTGYMPASWLDIPRTYAMRWCDVPAYFSLIRHLAPDIGVAPLEPHRFNRGKSAIKYVEYTLAGAAGVYADLDPYQPVIKDGLNGLMAEHTAEAWEARLSSLIESEDMRRSIHAAAMADVAAYHSPTSRLATILAHADNFMIVPDSANMPTGETLCQ